MVVEGVGLKSILSKGVLPLGEVVGLVGDTLRVSWVCAFCKLALKVWGGDGLVLVRGVGLCC